MEYSDTKKLQLRKLKIYLLQIKYNNFHFPDGGEKVDFETLLEMYYKDLDYKYRVIVKTFNENPNRWGRYITPTQLKTKLTDTLLNTLADELINKGFIASTDKDCFVWALGGSEKVDKFKPIEWVVSKLALRELLTPILGTISNQHIREIKMLFTKKGKPLELNKQKKDEYSRHIKDIESIIKKLNLPTTPTA